MRLASEGGRRKLRHRVGRIEEMNVRGIYMYSDRSHVYVFPFCNVKSNPE